MCGIIGSTNLVNEKKFKSAAATIKHRGPDTTAYYGNEHILLAHHRLAILDLSPNGAQPYHYQNLSLVYNGEIYNYQSIREELSTLGYNFISNSDTEVLIKAFHCWHVKAVEKLNGMFAFAIYDHNDHAVYLFRDRLGIKPLYYALDGGLSFCSELRGLLPLLSSKDINLEAVYEYFRVGYISRNKSIFNNIQKLLPGHYLHYKPDGQHELKSYWSFQHIAIDNSLSEEEWQDKVHQQLIQSVTSHMISDVPVGVFLSGGLDSSLVSAILNRHYGNIHTFTIGFKYTRFDESPYARQIAQHLGTKHAELILDMEDARKTFENFYEIFDEPFADTSGVPTAIVSHLAQQNGVKVVLSADGGDELFAGYDHYYKTDDYYNQFFHRLALIRPWLRPLLSTLLNTNIPKRIFYKNIFHKLATLEELLGVKNQTQFYRAFLANQATREMKGLLRYEIHEQTIQTKRMGIEGFMQHDLTHYLPDDLLVKSDRATMYHGIEGRLPFLDHQLVEMSQQLPSSLKWRSGTSKWILRKILSEYIPEGYFQRPKKGFSIPIFNWFSNHLDKQFQEYLQPHRIKATGIFQEKEVALEYKKYLYFKQRGEESNIEKMWRILGFMMWWEKWNS